MFKKAEKEKGPLRGYVDQRMPKILARIEP
jgi:hypothetical protein